MFAGGTDTSTVTMEWAMSELLRNPRIMKKLQAELDAVIGKERLVKETDVKNLPYLQAVIKETFRLHPVGPLLVPHESTSCCKVANYEIPAGTRLYVNTWAIGRDPNAWENPLEFDPERFMTGNIDVTGQDFRLLPFGSGRRGCPGIPLGMVIVQFAMAALVHAFDWSLPPGTIPQAMDMTEAFGLTVPRASALFAIAAPRQGAHLY